MLPLIFIATSFLLLGGFLVLAGVERKRGLRVAGAWRNALDAKVSRIAFIVQHVDWGAFVKHLVGTAFERVAHDVAHGVLRLVRSAERLLTRAVRSLRARRGVALDVDAEEPEAGMLQTGILRIRHALRRARAASRKPMRKPRLDDKV